MSHSHEIGIWMPVYPGDYLADTLHYTTEQHGAYFLLKMHYWRTGPLPDDEAMLANIARMSYGSDAWSNAWAVLKKSFEYGEDGLLHDRRIDREFREATEKRKKSTERAEKAANARWRNATSNAQASPQALHMQCPSPSPSPSPKEEKPSGKPEGDSRHCACKEFVHAYWAGKHPGEAAAPWDGSEAKQLNSLLRANPGLSPEGFKRLLDNRERSDVNHSDRPREWLSTLTNFARGPLDRFNRPKGDDGPAKLYDPCAPRESSQGIQPEKIAEWKRARDRGDQLPQHIAFALARIDQRSKTDDTMEKEHTHAEAS